MNHNIAANLPILAEKMGTKPAVIFGGMKPDANGNFKYEKLSFSELEERSLLLANRLSEIGLKVGDKVLVFVKPCLNFSAITFALFRLGLVPIFIDPGMGKKNLLRAVEQIKPDALIAEKQVHWLRKLYSNSFQSIKYQITVSGATWWHWGGKLYSIADWITNYEKTSPRPKLEERMYPSGPNDSAAILFTSGGTGIPKGVLYTHDIFNAQVERLKNLFQLGPDQIDLPGFPLFSLFTITMGMTSAIPSMDPSKPSKANPQYLVKNIRDHKATFLAGSPAIWKNLADYCEKENIQLPSVKYLVMFGAPIPIELHQRFKTILPHGHTFTPYGATECLPVANISGKDIEGEIETKVLQGRGTCVGLPAPDTKIAIIQITDDILTKEEQFQLKAPYELGEIAVLSRTVTPEYVGMPQKTSEAKVYGEQGEIWHRMGDLGYLDEQGRLWFVGRKSHKLLYQDKVLGPIPIETLINQIPEIRKSALIQKGKDELEIVIEGKRNSIITEKLEDLISKNNQLSPIKKISFLESFPVDVRHNIKIDRLKISQYAQQGKLQ